MSIRFPYELAAAAEYAEGAVETSLTTVAAPAEAVFASATYEHGMSGTPIRVSVGPGFRSPVSARKPIPGQTYH